MCVCVCVYIYVGMYECEYLVSEYGKSHSGHRHGYSVPPEGVQEMEDGGGTGTDTRRHVPSCKRPTTPAYIYTRCKLQAKLG